ncbi:NAD(P)H-quinone oxidoreductase subunit 5 [Oxalobacteraceae bacterium GrIS 2.11]
MTLISALRFVNLWLLPVCLAGFSFLSSRISDQKLWPYAKLCSLIVLILSLLVLSGTCLEGAEVFSVAPFLTLGAWGSLSLSVRADMIGSLFLVMVSLIGWIITGFSHHYLQGEARQKRYVAALFMTIAAVTVVVIANNVLVLSLAWVVTSLSLHRLLTFYPNRPQAIFAAHKKFIVSRLGDLCLFAAIGLIAQQMGSLEFDHLAADISHLAVVPAQLQIAALLLALSAALKCAQLPFHGWLIQVMEAPTPVSALLHAGIVNLGGLLLIRFSFLMGSCTAAQLFLVVVGSLTTAIAAMVMMTRISIKVSLAWSTCAQMGFMLMQCGLGAYELAALHLLAHSLYKAHAFLSSGSTNARLLQKTGATQRVGLVHRITGAVVGVLIVFGLFHLTHHDLSTDQPLLAFAVIIALALAPLLSFKPDGRALRNDLLFLVYAAGLALLYLTLHQLCAAYLGLPSHDQAGWMSFRVGWVVAVFTLLYLLQSIVLEQPDHVLSRRLYPFFYGGFFLDDLFTRLTFWVWPVRTASINSNQE